MNWLSHKNKLCHNTYIYYRDGILHRQSEFVHPDYPYFSVANPHAADTLYFSPVEFHGEVEPELTDKSQTGTER
jgi:hypothetical protein